MGSACYILFFHPYIFSCSYPWGKSKRGGLTCTYLLLSFFSLQLALFLCKGLQLNDIIRLQELEMQSCTVDFYNVIESASLSACIIGPIYSGYIPFYLAKRVYSLLSSSCLRLSEKLKKLRLCVLIATGTKDISSVDSKFDLWISRWTLSRLSQPVPATKSYYFQQIKNISF